jgi:hypothetical protein
MKNSLAMLGAASVLVLVACGGGGGGNTPVQSTESSTGLIRIAITDAPVDDVFEVNVQFTGVTLKPESGDEIVITFDTPRDFDLLTLTGGLTAELLSDTTVPAGTYNWVRLAVNAEFDDIYDSYAVLPTGTVELRVPSGSQNGLKLVSGFTVVANGATNVVIDWDLRKALSDPRGQPGLHLRPALRITDMAVYGTLSGMVAPGLVNDVDTCTNDPALNIGSAVYIYQGAIDSPGDIGDAVNDPFATATVSQIGDEYLYEVNFLPVGEYTAAFTCQASDDDAELDDGIAFSAPQIFTINDGGVTEVNF